MELKELTEKTLQIFQCENASQLSDALMKTVKENNIVKFQSFKQLVETLDIDWMQMIYQYYLADRKEKMQDYTPTSLAVFAAKLAGDADSVVDMCAGSGALTLQHWALAKDTKIERTLLEFDSNVLPFTLFNMMLRNIECTVVRCDILTQEEFERYEIKQGLEFGMLT